MQTKEATFHRPEGGTYTVKLSRKDSNSPWHAPFGVNPWAIELNEDGGKLTAKGVDGFLTIEEAKG